MDSELVYVRAQVRKGYEGFCRGGKRWPTSGEFAIVTLPLLALLADEPMLSVLTGRAAEVKAAKDGVDINSLAAAAPLDLPKREDINAGLNALDELKRVEQKIAEEEALAKLAEKRRKLAELQEQRKQAEAEQAELDAIAALEQGELAEADAGGDPDADGGKKKSKKKSEPQT